MALRPHLAQTIQQGLQVQAELAVVEVLALMDLALGIGRAAAAVVV
jgi:hypothetical protein